MEWITCIVLETLGGDCMNHRKAIESLYKGLCDIYEYETSKDPVTGRTKKSKEFKMNASPIPCRISYNSSQVITQAEGGILVQNIKLFLAPEIDIKPNSKIVVTQNGRTVAYKNSSVPMVYDSHQEINLEIFDRWS